MGDLEQDYSSFCSYFVESFEKIIKTVGVECSLDQVPEDHKPTEKLFASTLMGINGYFQETPKKFNTFLGSIVIFWEESTYLNLCSTYLYEEVTEYSSEVGDIGMEILNMVVGNAKGELAEDGCRLQMSIPSHALGIVGTQGTGKMKVKKAQFKGTTPKGIFYVEINYIDTI